eukprot:m.278771 g.278771  ORF g.278771 m.278771 type:complete len:53 (-) comp15739_c0_seq21:2035-2193(-)
MYLTRLEKLDFHQDVDQFAAAQKLSVARSIFKNYSHGTPYCSGNVQHCSAFF